MHSSPRYFPGRKHVLAMCPVKSIQPFHPGYMVLSSEPSTLYCSHKTVLLARKGDSFLLQSIEDPETTFLTPINSVLVCNQSHLFDKDVVGNFVFEDGVKINYSNKSVKMKLYQILFSLQPLLEKMDFEGEE